MKTKYIILVVLTFLNVATLFSQTSASIKKHNREVVFSNKPIEPGDESSLITEYHVGDPLYFRFYMDSTVKQFIDKWKYSKTPEKFCHFMVNLYQDDQFKGFFVIKIPGFNELLPTLNSFGADLQIPNAPTNSMSEKVSRKIYLGNKLDKEHKIKIEFLMCDGNSYYQKYATGTFKILPDTRSGLEKANVTDAFQLSHLKKMVFSTKPFSDKITEQDLVKEYTVGGPLYYKFFLDNTVDELAKKNNIYSCRAFYKFYLDGKKIYEGGGKDLEKNDASKTGQFMTDKKEETGKVDGAFSTMIIENISLLKGSHVLKTEVYLSDRSNGVKQLIAEGEITLHYNSISKDHPMFSYELPTPGMKDPVLEKKMVELYNQKWGSESVAKSAMIYSYEWGIFRNALTGEPTGKGINAIMYVVTPKGCAYVCAGFQRNHEGGGKYGPVFYYGYCQDYNKSVPCK